MVLDIVIFVFVFLVLLATEAALPVWVLFFVLGMAYWRMRRFSEQGNEISKLERRIEDLESKPRGVSQGDLAKLTARIYAAEQELRQFQEEVRGEGVPAKPAPVTVAAPPPSAAIAARDEIAPPVVPSRAEIASPRAPVAPLVAPPAAGLGEAPVVPSQPKAPVAPPEVKPTLPVVPTPVVTPPAPTPPVKTAPPPPAPARPKPPRVEWPKPAPAPAMARAAAPPVSPASSAVAEAPRATLEETLGGNWLNKLGIVILVFGVVSFLIWQFGGTPHGKIFLGYLTALGTLGLGIVLEKRERYRTFARSALGGGWALTFFTTYAMHHVEASRILQSQVADLVLMLIVAAGMVAHTLRYRSQVVTGLALLLGFSTVTLSHDTVYSLTASAVLAAALVAIVRRLQWFELEVFGILATYLNHFLWLRPIIEPMGAQKVQFAEFWSSALILAFYWAVFRFSYLARKIADQAAENVSLVAALLNTGLLLSLMKYQSVRPDLAFWVLLGLGATELTLGQLPVTRRRRIAFVTLTTLGAALMVAAIPFRYSGTDVTVLWLLEAEVFLLCGVLAREVVFRRAGLVAGLLTAGHLLVIDFTQVFGKRILDGLPAMPEVPLGVVFALATFVFYMNAHFVARRWSELFEHLLDEASMEAFSYGGALLALLGAWLLWPGEWTAVAWAALGAAMALGGLLLDSPALRVQATALGGSAFLRALFVNLDVEGTYDRLTYRMVTVGMVALLMYLASKLIGMARAQGSSLLRGAHTWAAALLVVVLSALEMPNQWVMLHWAAFTLVLGLAAAALQRKDFAFQSNILAAATAMGTLFFMGDVPGTYPTVTLRLVNVLLVTMGLYAYSRWSFVPGMEITRHLRAVHTTAATVLMASLMWYELPTAWSTVVWMAYALLLVVLGRGLSRQDLPLQGQALALVAVTRLLMVNIRVEEDLRGVSLRLVTMAAVGAMAYALSRVAEVKDLALSKRFPAVWTWAGSLVVSLLLYYELRSLSVAVAWAALGVLLFELGSTTGSRALRLQGYAALASSFVRLFFVNLNAVAAPGEISARVYTIVPLALAYFYVYGRIASADEPELSMERSARIAHAHAWLGVVALAALIRFELDPNWVAAGWAGLVVAAMATAWLTEKRVFLAQAMALSYLVVFRGLAHNLYGTGTPSELWTQGRLMTVGAAAGILLLSLPFAFKLRVLPGAAEKAGWLRRLTPRPEQHLFFLPVALVTLLFAREMESGMITTSWGVEGVAIFLLALWAGERSYRLTGLGLLLLCVAKIVVDVWGMGWREKTITAVVLGLALLVVSFLYNRYRDTIRQYI